ncbi:CHAP domain-containing protein [bacterium]|nr:MAG: CHAP domain-containing protein [bacterium]
MVLNQARLSARVARARSAVAHGTAYRLGKGGFDPRAKLPHDSSKGCDCSGFVAWVCGLRRDQVNARKPWSKLLPWIETTMVRADAVGKQLVFVRISEPVAGCLVVYGDKGRSQGHIGVVTRVGPNKKSIDVVDCSSGQYKRTGEAIDERNGDFFINAGAIFVVLKEDFV